jgi:drug/metabolite transporter (DMT)-like permease
VAGGVIASAVNALLARRTAQAGANPLVTSCWQLTSGAMLTALLMTFFPATGAHVFDASRPALISLIYLGLVVSGGVYILSNYALRHLPVGRVGLFSCLVGPVGTAMAALLLGTELSTLDLVALAIVVGAVLLPSVLAWSQAPPR